MALPPMIRAIEPYEFLPLWRCHGTRVHCLLVFVVSLIQAVWSINLLRKHHKRKTIIAQGYQAKFVKELIYVNVGTVILDITITLLYSSRETLHFFDI